MVLPEIRLIRAAIVLAEELNFTNASARLHIDQSTLSKRILELEHQLDVRLFERNRQRVNLTEAGKKFVEETQQGMVHIERGVSLCRSDNRNDDILRVGRTPYTDPWLCSLMLSIRLPLHPDLRIQWSSNFSHEIAREVAIGILDLALTTGIPDSAKLTHLRLEEFPFFVGLSRKDSLAENREIRLSHMHKRTWVLLSRHVNPHLYDSIQQAASSAVVGPSDLHHITSAEEAVPLILEHQGLALLHRTGAWRIARDEITMRPLAEDAFRLVTNLTAHADSESRLGRDFVKAVARRIDSLRKPAQGALPLND